MTEDEMLALYRRHMGGEKVAALAAEIGCHPNTLLKKFHDANLTPRRGVIPHAGPIRDIMLKMRERGMTHDEIAKSLGYKSGRCIQVALYRHRLSAARQGTGQGEDVSSGIQAQA